MDDELRVDRIKIWLWSDVGLERDSDDWNLIIGLGCTRVKRYQGWLRIGIERVGVGSAILG